jgi:hypothetical protein
MVNNGGLPWQDFNFCGTIDNRTQQVTPLSNDSTKGVVDGRTGDTLNFLLNPAFTLPITPPPGFTPNVVVKDILPKGLTYTAGSASLLPTLITPNPDGATTLEWNLGPGGTKPLSYGWVKFHTRVKS